MRTSGQTKGGATRRIRPSLTFANVVSVIALFVAFGGTAMASLIITKNSQVDRGTISGHRPPSGEHPNIIAGSINGKDIADQSGVDSCTPPLTAKYGPICVGTDGGKRSFGDAGDYCAGFGLRLPTLGEARALGTKYNVPGVPVTGFFWTDNPFISGNTYLAYVGNEFGGYNLVDQADSQYTVCVTDPSA
jgi:hypothetical protein